ncbi:hypothetical protein DYB28_000401, partial [Aphanomyces astaci]
EITECCLGLARVFTEMAEVYLDILLGDSPMNQVLVVDTLLECMAFPDPERTSLHLSYRIPFRNRILSTRRTDSRSATIFFLAAITIPFWFAFTEALRFVPDVHQKQTLLRNFAPSLTNLSRICMHTMCFRDGFRELPSDKQQDFKNFRMELGDILQDCCVLLGTDLVLAHCVQGLHAILTDPDSSPDAQWESIEAHLYSFRSIARQVELQLQDSAKAGHPPMDETPLHTIFAFLPRFPAHPAIQYTSCLVISRYAEWLAGAGAAYLASLLTFVDATVTMSATRHDYHDWYGRLF